MYLAIVYYIKLGHECPDIYGSSVDVMFDMKRT